MLLWAKSGPRCVRRGSKADLSSVMRVLRLVLLRAHIPKGFKDESEEDSVRIEASEAPRESARVHRTAGGKPAKPHHRGKKPNSFGPKGGGGGGGGGYKGGPKGGGYKGNKGPRPNDSRTGPVKTSGGATVKPKGNKDRNP